MTRISIDTAGIAMNTSVVSAAHFGGNYTAFQSLWSFGEQAEDLGVQHVRWPGGTRSEMQFDINDADSDGDSGEYVYSLTHEDILTIPGKGLSDVLQYANENSFSFSMIAPTIRYLADTAQAEADVRDFVTKLLNGDFGALPTDFTIELGNESVGHGEDSALAYGAVANAQITALREVMADPELNPNGVTLSIAIQMGQTHEEDAAVRSMIDPDNLVVIDTIVNHHSPLNIRTHNRTYDTADAVDDGDSIFERFEDYVSDWEAAVGAARGSQGPASLDYYVSEFTSGDAGDVADADLQYQDFGARQGRTTIDTFSQIIGAGADSAALWGIDARSNGNWYSVLDDGNFRLSHGGEVFRLMSESLIGTSLIEGYSQPVPATFNGDYEDYWIYAFEDDTRVVMFLAANDITGNQQVTIELGSIGAIESVSSVRVGTEMDAAYSGDLNDPQARLHELPVVEHSVEEFEGNTFTYTLTQDYEVVRFIVEKSDLPPEPVQINGTNRGDVLIGGSSDEIMLGRKGSDNISAGAGDDKLLGAAGKDELHGGDDCDLINGGRSNDVLYGDAGDDILIGAHGRDVLNGGEGNDNLNGGRSNDVLYGDAGDDILIGAHGRDVLNGGEGNDILTGGRGADVFVFASGDGSDVVTDFRSKGDILRFEGLTVDDLTIDVTGTDATIHYGVDDYVVLRGVDHIDLTDAVFDFV